MCWSKKCCFVMDLELGCLLIGVVTLIVSLGIFISSIILLAIEEEHLQHLHTAAEHILGVFHLDVNTKSKELILSMILLMTVLSTGSSISLIVGVRKRTPGFVLVFFCFGIFFAFFMSLCSLLLLLKSSWWLAMILMIATLIKIHFLVATHTFYELLVRGKAFAQSLLLDSDNTLLMTG